MLKKTNIGYRLCFITLLTVEVRRRNKQNWIAIPLKVFNVFRFVVSSTGFYRVNKSHSQLNGRESCNVFFFVFKIYRWHDVILYYMQFMDATSDSKIVFKQFFFVFSFLRVEFNKSTVWSRRTSSAHSNSYFHFQLLRLITVLFIDAERLMS